MTRAIGFLVLAVCGLQRLPHAVDRSKFRTCDQSSFCRRFKKWIARPDVQEALWLVVPGSCQAMGGGGWNFLVKHKYDAHPSLTLRINLFSSGMIRVRLTEKQPLHPRYEIPAGDVMVEPLPEQPADVEIRDLQGASVMTFHTQSLVHIQVVLIHEPLAVTVEVNGELIQSLNARNFLNFERYRRPPQGSRPCSREAHMSPLDAAAWSEASTDGLWKEDFGPHTDRKPFGPAAVGMGVTFEGNVSGVFGLPEHAAGSSLQTGDEPYRCFNLDVCEYELNSPMSLYGTVPILHAIHWTPNGSHISGFLWNNPSDTFVWISRKPRDDELGPMCATWTSESGILDVTVFAGPSPRDVMRQFHILTGFAPLPPLWSLGKHQCRWNYFNQEEVEEIHTNYDAHDIPFDVVWLDIEHTDDKRYFTWHPDNFATPEKMIAGLAASGRKLVTIVDPHIKKDEGYTVYKEIHDAGLCIKRANWQVAGHPADPQWTRPSGLKDPAIRRWSVLPTAKPDSVLSMADFEGWCWPGTSIYPDFTDPELRDLWARNFAYKRYRGTTPEVFTWNDMNEPSVFNGPEVTCPRDALHPFGAVEHRDVHNLYGLYVQRATFEGQLLRAPRTRPFVLSRAFFTGSHRFGAVWTGDNAASWEHLAVSVPMLLALGLGGLSFAGADIGGFFGHPSEELLVRWYQLGALAYPFFRQHAHEASPRREPWLWGAEALGRIRAAVRTRYRLLPYWYAAFAAFHFEGLPVVRPLWWEFDNDPRTSTVPVAVEESLMVGEALLVRSVHKPLEEQSHVSVYLPVGKGGGWYSFLSRTFFAPGFHEVALDMESIPAFWRAGSVVPTKRRARRSTHYMSRDPFTLAVYLDAVTDIASGIVYIDDYQSLEYRDNDFLLAELGYSDGLLRQVSSQGNLHADVCTLVERIHLYGLKSAPTKVTLEVNGESTEMLPVNLQLIYSAGIANSMRTPLYAAVVEHLSIDLKSGSAWGVRLHFSEDDHQGGRSRSRVGRECLHKGFSHCRGNTRIHPRAQSLGSYGSSSSVFPSLVATVLAKSWRSGVRHAR